ELVDVKGEAGVAIAEGGAGAGQAAGEPPRRRLRIAGEQSDAAAVHLEDRPAVVAQGLARGQRRLEQGAGFGEAAGAAQRHGDDAVDLGAAAAGAASGGAGERRPLEDLVAAAGEELAAEEPAPDLDLDLR